MKRQKCDFGAGDRVALIVGTNVGTVIDMMKSGTQEGPVIDMMKSGTQEGPRAIRTLLLVRWDKDEERQQPWGTWEEEYDLDYERSKTVTTHYKIGDVVEGNLNGCLGVVEKVNNAYDQIMYYINWTPESSGYPTIPNSWESQKDLDDMIFKKGKSGKRKQVRVPEDEESTMTEEFMEELRTISLGEVLGVLLMEHGLAQVLNTMARHYLEEQESLDLMDRFGDRP